MNENNLEKYRPLLMGLMDGELSPEEAAEVNDALTRSAALREEYETILASAGKLEALSMIEPADEIARRLWRSPYHRLSRNAGIWMVLGGYVLLILYAVYEGLVAEGPIIPKLTGAAILIGICVLLITFISERVKTYKVDPYKEIER